MLSTEPNLVNIDVAKYRLADAIVSAVMQVGTKESDCPFRNSEEAQDETAKAVLKWLVATVRHQKETGTFSEDRLREDVENEISGLEASVEFLEACATVADMGDMSNTSFAYELVSQAFDRVRFFAPEGMKLSGSPHYTIRQCAAIATNVRWGLQAIAGGYLNRTLVANALK